MYSAIVLKIPQLCGRAGSIPAPGTIRNIKASEMRGLLEWRRVD